jgi:N-acetylmuramoyl-L-alanine amidase
LNLLIANALETALTKNGYEVVMTHKGLAADVKLQNISRCGIANRAEVEVYIAIHLNAAPSKAAKGFEVIYCPGSANGKRWATGLATALKGVPGLTPRPRSVITDEDTGRGPYTVLRRTKMPAVIVECCFLSNDSDRKLITSKSGRDAVVRALAVGTQTYFNK